MGKSTQSKKNKNKEVLTKNNNESAKIEKLVVKKHFTLDFSSCEVVDHPPTKNHFKLIIQTLQDFADIQKYETLSNHKLDNKGTGKNSEHIQYLVKSFPKLKSADVGNRNGANGGIRLLYYVDENDSTIAHIINCYIDDH